MMNKRIEVGSRSKNFALKDQHGKLFSLTNYREKKVLLSFHPLAWTSVCAKQMQSLEDKKQVFDSLDTVAVGISVDAVPSKNAWAKSLKIKDTRLLSDFWPHGKVAQLYGIFDEEDGVSKRANIIIDKNGEVIFVKVYQTDVVPDIQEVIEQIKRIASELKT